MNRSSASSRRLKTRSSASSRSSGRDLRVRRDVVRVDHRQVETGLDAVVQEHAVERRSGRAARRRSETLQTPSEVLTPGISALIRRIPSIVSTALGFHSSSPVVSVNVRQSKIRASRSRPCSSQHSSVIRCAISSLRSAVFAIPTSSIVSAISAAPWALAIGTTRSSLSRPASRLIELTIARPGICRSAVSITSGSVESTWIGAGWVSEIRLTTWRICSSSSWRSVSATQTSSTWAPPVDLILGDRQQAVVVVGQQQLLGLARALGVDALADERRARILDERGGRDHAADMWGARRSGRGAGHAALDALGDRLDVVWRRAAAAADDRDAVALDELPEHVGERLGLLREDRLAVRALERQSGVRDAVHGLARELAEEADRVAHVLGAGRAVEADDVDVERLERGQHRADVGAEQHLAALGQQRHAALDRQPPVLELERLAGAEDRGLDLEDVLRGLDDDQVDAALDERLRPAR